MKNKLKIGMFTHSYYPFISGVTVDIERTRQRLSEMGHKVYIITPEVPGLPKRPDIILLDSIKVNIKNKFHIGIPIIPTINKRIKKINLDIIHLHHPFLMGLISLYYSKKLIIPLVFTYHTRYEDYATYYIPYLPKKFVSKMTSQPVIKFCNKTDFVITKTEFLKKYLKKKGVRTEIRVIPPGINVNDIRLKQPDLRKKFKIDKNGKILLCVTRISKEKNLDLLINAFYRISKLQKNTYLFIVGDGIYMDHIKKIVEKLRLGDKIKLVGSVAPEKIWDYYKMADLLVHSAVNETLGFIFVEAFSMGLPVVAVKGYANVDVIRNGYNGFLTRNNVKHFSSTIIKVLNNRKLMNKLKRRAKLSSKKYDIKKSCDLLIKVYNDAIENHKNRKM